MKKVLVFILSFILFSFNVNALTNVNSMDVNVVIDESGNSHIDEAWHLPKQSDSVIAKNFYNTKDVTIKDLIVKDENDRVYNYSDNYKDEGYTYKLVSNGSNYVLYINTLGEETKLIINYNVSGIIKKYNDTTGINWYFLNTLNDMTVKTINITISDYLELNESNTALYAVGKNVDCSLKNGKIILSAKDLERRNKIVLYTTYTDVSHTNLITINDSFNHYFEHNKPSVFNDLKNFVASEALLLIIIIVIIIVSSLIIKKIIIKSQNNIFECVKIRKKEDFIESTSNAIYEEYIPCDGDLYRLEFISSLFGITKNRSNIISAIILKWILAGYAKMDVATKTIIIKDNIKFTNELDQELYGILKSVSKSLTLKDDKISKYFDNNKDIINEWYLNIYHYGINYEYERSNARVKLHKIIIEKSVVETANKIVGLKKYLLNFNQVPRSTKLTKSMYEDLLIISTLLGVSTSFSEEILRKNKDNDLAKMLMDFDNIKNDIIPLFDIKTSKSTFKKLNPIPKVSKKKNKEQN